MPVHPLSSAVALAAILTTLPAAATTYHLVDLGEDTVANALNRHGHVAGVAPDGRAGLYKNGVWHSKRDRHHDSVAWGLDDAGNLIGQEWDGRATGWQSMYYPLGARNYPIPMPAGALYEAPQGISPDGTRVVGTFVDGVSSQKRCFQWHPGDAAVVDLGLPPGQQGCEGFAVNDAGEIVGQLEDADMHFTSFTWKDGQFTLITRPGPDNATIMAVNRHGHAIASKEGYGEWDWYWNGSHLRRLPQTGWVNMIDPTALNDRGDIVGAGQTTPEQYLTIVKYSDGDMIDLVPLIDNAEGWDFSYGGPSGIDERGVIAGTAWVVVGSTVHSHGYLLVPND